MKEKNKVQKNKNHKLGFTLLELLVVVLIIGILASIALPQYKKAVLKSKFATIKNLTVALHEAEERYYLVYGQYTASIEDLDVEIKNSGCSVGGATFVYCNLYDNNKKILMQYIIYKRTSIRRCDAFPADTTSLANKICQMDTKKTSPLLCDNYSCAYYY